MKYMELDTPWLRGMGEVKPQLLSTFLPQAVSSEGTNFWGPQSQCGNY